MYEITNAGVAGNIFGGNSGTVSDIISQKYVAPENQTLCTVYLKVYRISAGITKPSLVLRVRQGGGPIDGEQISMVSVPATSLPTSLGAYVPFVLPSCVSLTAGTTYWFTFENFEQPYVTSFGYYVAGYRNSDQYSYSSQWLRTCSACVPGYALVENTNREWGLKFEGPDPLPTVSDLKQSRLDGTTALAEDEKLDQGELVLSAKISSPFNKKLKLEVSIEEASSAPAIYSSELIDSGGVASITLHNFPDGDYLWRARTVDIDGATSSWTSFGAPEVQDFRIHRTPIIIVPGILGTYLGQGDDLLWANLARMLLDVNDEFLSTGLAMDSEGNSVNNITVGEAITVVLNHVPGFEVNTFLDLKESFNNIQYIQDKNLFFFPYDWRVDLNITKDLLKQKIDEVKQKTGATKVDIIAHSMGGLLTKNYLNLYGKESIDKLIFVGTPHLGAPKAAKTLLVGERFDIPMLADSAMRSLALNAPAVYELLPGQTYFNQAQGYIKTKGSTDVLGYSATKDFLVSGGVNWNILDKTQNFFGKSLEEMSLDGIDAYNIAGCRSATQAGYEFGADKTDIVALRESSGDGTVPLESADYVNVPNNHKFYFKDATHSKLPSAESVRNIILNIIKGEQVTLPSDLAQGDSSFCDFKGKELLWHSPVEVHVYDELGNHTGPTENNVIEYNIPGVEYQIVGHNKFIFLPTDTGHVYRIVSHGTDAGTFDLFVRENNNGEIASTKLYNDIPITTSSNMEFSLSSESVDNEITISDGEEATRVITAVAAQGMADGDVVITTTPTPTESAASTTEEVLSEPAAPAPQTNTITGGGGGGGTYYYASPAPEGQVLGASIGFADSAELKRKALLEQIVVILQQIISLLRQQLQIKTNIVY